MTSNGQTRMERRKQKQKQSKKKLTWRKIIRYALIAVLAVGLGIGGLFTYYIVTAPKLDIDKLSDPFSSKIYDMDENLFAEPGTEQRTKVSFDDLPDVLIDAITATEDNRFFTHMGIDIRRIGGAIKANITRGFGAEGASTITQQVVENSFLTADKKLKRKVQEQWLSLKLEREYSKEEILEMYLNKIFFGSGAYGVGKASEVYFGKTDLHDLTLIEAAILAGLPQRPSAYNPYENPDLTADRVDTVLKLMVRHGKITQEEADEAREIDITSLLAGKPPQSGVYEAFLQKVEREVKEKIDGANMYTDGLKIYTTLDPKAQEHVEHLLKDNPDEIPFPDDEMKAGMVVLDTSTGAIRAIGGNREKENIDGYNYAIQGGRQPGSTFKPLLSFAPAIEYRKISTYHQLHDDAPYEIYGNEIRNWTRRYEGWMTARHALYQSLNVPTLKLFHESFHDSGFKEPKEFVEGLGITFETDAIDEYDVIGGAKTNVTPLQLAGAFRPFGNEGIYNEPYSITKVEFPDGEVIDLQPQSEAVMADYTAYMTTDMLKDVVTIGTGKNANVPHLPIAGKTGTTNVEGKDGANNSWFVGYTTNYTIAAWTGYEDNNKTFEQTQVPHALFRSTMIKLSEGIETPDFVKPNSVVEVAVERGTNPPELASDYTPKENVITELFVKGHEPTRVSEKFDQIDPVTNLKAKYDADKQLIEVTWDYSQDEDVIFEVSTSVNDGSMQVLSTTDDYGLEITNVDLGSTYEIQVVVLDEADHSNKSDPKSTKIKLPEEDDDNNNENNDDNDNNAVEDEPISAIENLQANYDEARKLINASWTYNGPPAQFIVNVNGEEKTIKAKSLEIVGIDPGNTYTITVTPVGIRGSNEGKAGPSQSVEVTIEDQDENNQNDAGNNN